MEKQSAQQIRREEARRLTLGYLAERQSLSFQGGAVERGVNRDNGGDYTTEEIGGALAFLVDAGLIKEVTRKLAASKAWQVTTAGVLAHEKGEL